MTIHSKRERDRIVQEQLKDLEDAHKQHMESLDALDKMWQTARDHNQDVIDRTTRGVIIEDEEPYMSGGYSDSSYLPFKMPVVFRRLRVIE